LCVSYTNQGDPLGLTVLTVDQALDKEETEDVCANQFHLHQVAVLPGIGWSSAKPSTLTLNKFT